MDVFIYIYIYIYIYILRNNLKGVYIDMYIYMSNRKANKIMKIIEKHI
jgi:hypothetical protein